MDIYKAIEELRAEKERLDQAIAALESTLEAKGTGQGRVWSSNARRAAAERMRKYWAKRRGSAGQSGNSEPSGE